MTLEELNFLPWQDAVDWFHKTCAAQNWCELMANSRPFDSQQALVETAKAHWQTMSD